MKYLDELRLVDDGGWLATALASSKKNVDYFSMIASLLSIKYNDYSNIISSHLVRPPVSDLSVHAKLLVDYYENAPSTLNRLLKNRRNEHELSECPYCGYPFSPDTLDHFVPKDDWPEFTIYPNNLVPQCRGCAPIKSAKYYCGTNNAALFIHPIFHDYLSLVGFKIEIDFSATNNPTFNITFMKSDQLGDVGSQRVIRHMKNLSVKNRIQDYSRKEFNRWKNLIRARRFDVRVALQQRIDEKPNELISQDWNTALYKGMLGNNDVITYLNGLAPHAVVPVIATNAFVEIDIT